MKRSKRIYILLAALVVICAAAFGAYSYEQKQEEIQNSGEIILALSPVDVQSLSWSYGEESLAFSRGEDGLWYWETDSAFPVSGSKVEELLGIFSSFSAGFVIENVSDYSIYGLDAPECTIILETDRETYTLSLGDFSKLDSKRYVSLGDGRAYLVNEDPMESFEITVRDMIEHDKTLSYDTATALSFSGAENWSLSREEDSGKSVSENDVYFTGELPLDTYRVDDYISGLSLMELSEYVSYNVTEEELSQYGLNEPELSITVDYTEVSEEAEDGVPGSYTLHISRSAEQRAMSAEEEEALESYVAYARVGESQIIYEISSSDFESLMAAGYDDLRHREPFTADFAIVNSIDASIDGKSYSFARQEAGEDEGEPLWLYGSREIDIAALQSALEEMSAESFTDEYPTEQLELALSFQLDSGNFPLLEIAIYRYDGSRCLVMLDGESFALVPRSEAVELMEAVNAIILG